MTRRAWEASARWAALGVLLGGLGVAAGPAEAVTLIQSCPYTIMQPGVYVLASDLTCPGPAITITADNVVLNLNGHTLTSDGGGGAGVRAEGTEANPTLEGLRVENGTVTGFIDGILLDNTPGARVASVAARATPKASLPTAAPAVGSRTTGRTATASTASTSRNGPRRPAQGQHGQRQRRRRHRDRTASAPASWSRATRPTVTPPMALAAPGSTWTAATSATAASAATRTSNNNRNGIEVNCSRDGQPAGGQPATRQRRHRPVDENLPRPASTPGAATAS